MLIADIHGLQFNTDGQANKGELYHLADQPIGSKPHWREHFAGLLTGEFRPPCKNEWYLSGAVPLCYKAPNNLTTSYWIIGIFEVERVCTWNAALYVAEHTRG